MSIDLRFLNQYVVVTLACLATGYALKYWIKRLKNQYIPLLLFIFGAILGCIEKNAVTLENIVYGSVAGLASIGMHQMFKQLIENKKKNPNPRDE